MRNPPFDYKNLKIFRQKDKFCLFVLSLNGIFTLLPNQLMRKILKTVIKMFFHILWTKKLESTPTTEQKVGVDYNQWLQRLLKVVIVRNQYPQRLQKVTRFPKSMPSIVLKIEIFSNQ